MPKAKPKTSAKTGTKTSRKTSAKAKTKAAKSAKAAAKSQPVANTTEVKVRKIQAPTHNQIAVKAYEIWIDKGRPAGQDAENWEAAKQALLDEA